MKTKYILPTGIVLMIILNSCLNDLLPIRGNGISITELRDTESFYKLSNATAIDVIYKKADSTSITVTADENLLAYIVTETYNNTLNIKYQPGNSHLDFKTQPVITVTSPILSKIVVSGSAAVLADKISGDEVILNISGSGDISTDEITCNSITIVVSGSGNINVKDCITQNSDLTISGSGNINLNGEGDIAYFKISGSGAIFAESFPVSSASITISASGNVFTNIENSLTATISGSGNIYLRGDPTITKNISGSGRIIKYK